LKLSPLEFVANFLVATSLAATSLAAYLNLLLNEQLRRQGFKTEGYF
jgi:hypothetical protein